MSTNWKAGDKALCIEPFIGVQESGRPSTYPSGLPVKGTTYLVGGLFEGDRIVGLQIVGLPAIDQLSGIDTGWWQARFRKIVPACDRATIQEEGLIPHEGFWEGRK